MSEISTSEPGDVLRATPASHSSICRPMGFLKDPRDKLSAAQFNGLQILARLGAPAGAPDYGVVHISKATVPSNSLAVYYLDAAGDLTHHKIERTAVPPVSECPWLVDAGAIDEPGTGEPWENFDFPALTLQPVLAARQWLRKRVAWRAEEVRILKLHEELGGDLAAKILSVAEAVAADRLMSFQTVLLLWRAASMQIASHKRLLIEPRPDEFAESHACAAFASAEHNFAALIWRDREITSSEAGLAERYLKNPSLVLTDFWDGKKGASFQRVTIAAR